MTGLKITSLMEETTGWLIARERLWLTEDGKRLVPDLHPDAARLFVAAGHRISRDDAERFGLLEDGHDVADLQDVPAEATSGGLTTEAPAPAEQDEQDTAEQDEQDEQEQDEQAPTPKPPQTMSGRRRTGKGR